MRMRVRGLACARLTCAEKKVYFTHLFGFGASIIILFICDLWCVLATCMWHVYLSSIYPLGGAGHCPGNPILHSFPFSRCEVIVSSAPAATTGLLLSPYSTAERCEHHVLATSTFRSCRVSIYTST